ncbi:MULTISPECIES: thioredoxin-disulfide reductase [Caldilinea]|jgi:thioredoxin reductase (NADPH)|uniref:Thioredoxin reductase n=1 Tax=Caldilinea aerophila (strain DSM 14535 / JCM 11387 / NBRC 104270 / STL-6-O1) TaxID=926550 RepID=I0I3F9_CALAS|nr:MULTISPECIES: thioredoxin-disulfide reductase [Caldilinea]MBO9394541.1 thioredoxin-disulfide reductase [Caldilinea sp.]BAL99796.1 thioredoxin reductase [Caldilinea aerophila DSM 14535 = NBRC 104270]GIV73605.1 MAG: thioredoxin reductase [Caldilinea sp.]
MTTVNGHGNTPQVENIIIVGSGPAGFTAGLYAARANLSPLLITGNEYGGQVSLTYDIENYPGFPESLSGPELVEKFKAQAEKFGTRVEFDYVTELVLDRHPFLVRTESGAEYQTRALILCTGARPRYLEVPGEKEFTGKGVSYCATCDGFFFRGKDVIVVGGGDSAAEEALFLTRYASRVRILHRRDKFRASKILQDRVFANEKIEVIWNTVVTEIFGENGTVTGVKTRNTVTGEAGELKTDGVFVFIGHLPNNDLFHGKLEMDEDGYLITDRKMRTNVPGVFAAGEIQDKVFKQVATSVGQGCAAAMSATRFLEELEDGRAVDLRTDPREFMTPRAPAMA